MKLKPVDTLGFPTLFARDRPRLRRAVEEDDAETIGKHFCAWRAWIVHVENVPANPGPQAVFEWSCGASTSARFETACLAYAFGRALFRRRRYADAHARFGLALEETMQCRDPLPLTPDACGAFRLRCLVRAQRLAICELNLERDGERMLAMALWLESATDAYRVFPRAARKEPAHAGRALVATALAATRRDRDAAIRSREWKLNPFATEMEDASRRPSRGKPIDATDPAGEFDWTRFTSDRPYAS